MRIEAPLPVNGDALKFDGHLNKCRTFCQTPLLLVTRTIQDDVFQAYVCEPFDILTKAVTPRINWGLSRTSLTGGQNAVPRLSQKLSVIYLVRSRSMSVY